MSCKSRAILSPLRVQTVSFNKIQFLWIPGIVNTFIGLFKDTTLVIIIGLFDILGQARLLQSNPDWMGKVAYETFFLVAVLFFVICFSMSRYSIRLEKRLNTDQ